MQIEIKIDENCKEPKIIVATDKMTEEISEIIKKLSEEQTKTIAGFKDKTAKVLETDSIFRIYASNSKVFAETDQGEFLLRMRLYEIEQCLDRSSFVQISNSEIINLKKVKRFDLSFSGTICVALLNGTITYVSRRYVTKIKQLLGI